MTKEIPGSFSAIAVGKQTISETASTEAAEWRFVTVTIIFVLALTSLPYVYGYVTAPPEKQFMGIMLDVPDHGQYFSWMRELTHAHLSANKLTPEPNQPIFFNLLWWGLGRLGWWLGLSYPAMFQLLRLVGGTLFLLLAYRLCAWFLPNRLMRRTAFLVIVLTSGFGWFLIILKYVWGLADPPFPLLVYIAEGNTFLGILGYPHFIAAALYVFVFDLILRGQVKGQLRYAVAAGLVALFFGWQHAYDLVLVYGILGGYGLLMLLRDRRLPLYLIKSGLIVGLISCSPALYSVLLTKFDPIWEEVLAQFANAGVYTPNLLQLPILLGLAFLLALFTIIRDNPLRLRNHPNNQLFLLAWFLSNFLLIYIPTDYQIHMLNGWQIPIAILATQGLFNYIAPWVEKVVKSNPALSAKSIQRGLALGLIIAILPTNLYLFTWRFVELARHDYPYYLHKDEVSALAWLEANSQPSEVALSSLTVGQYLPALTGMHAFLAHWAQTLDFFGKSAMVDEFFDQETSEARRQQILQQHHIDYVFYGPAERLLGGYNPGQSPLFVEVFTSPSTQIYRFKTENR